LSSNQKNIENHSVNAYKVVSLIHEEELGEGEINEGGEG
jgi:hypothetical protein